MSNPTTPGGPPGSEFTFDEWLPDRAVVWADPGTAFRVTATAWRRVGAAVPAGLMRLSLAFVGIPPVPPPPPPPVFSNTKFIDVLSADVIGLAAFLADPLKGLPAGVPVGTTTLLTRAWHARGLFNDAPGGDDDKFGSSLTVTFDVAAKTFDAVLITRKRETFGMRLDPAKVGEVLAAGLADAAALKAFPAVR